MLEKTIPLGIACALAMVPAVSSAGVPVVTDIGVDQLALDISDDGRVVVGQSLSAGQEGVFRWTPDTGLQNIGGKLSGLPGVSADGSIIAATVHDQYDQAAFWTESEGWRKLDSFELIPPYAGWATFSNGLSPSGKRMVGGTEPPPGMLRAFSFNPDTDTYQADFGFQELPKLLKGSTPEATAISDDGSVQVGKGNDQGGSYRALRWMNGTVHALRDGKGAPLGGEVVRCNTDCSVIVGGGGGSSAAKPILAWRLMPKSERPACYLNPLHGPAPFALRYYAHATSESGNIVAGTNYYVTEDNRSIARGFLWIGDANGGMMHDLETYLAGMGQTHFKGWSWVVTTNMSSDGRHLVGWGYDSTDRMRAWKIDFDREPGARGDKRDYTRCPTAYDKDLATGALAARAETAWEQPSGEFRTGDGRRYFFRTQGDHLLAGQHGKTPAPLVALGADTYYDLATRARLTFVRKADGKIAWMQEIRDGRGLATWQRTAD